MLISIWNEFFFLSAAQIKSNISHLLRRKFCFKTLQKATMYSIHWYHLPILSSSNSHNWQERIRLKIYLLIIQFTHWKLFYKAKNNFHGSFEPCVRLTVNYIFATEWISVLHPFFTTTQRKKINKINQMQWKRMDLRAESDFFSSFSSLFYPQAHLCRVLDVVCWVLSAECAPVMESDYLNLWSENMIVVKLSHKYLWTLYDV